MSKIVETLNGKLVYWVLSILVAMTGFFGNTILTDIRKELRDIRQQTSHIDVIDNRVERLETFHIGG